MTRRLAIELSHQAKKGEGIFVLSARTVVPVRRLTGHWVLIWGLSAMLLMGFSTSGFAVTDASAADSGLAEITVTAQKYNSTVQSTPISMSAVSAEQLAAAGITSIEQMAQTVPGLSMRSAGPGQTEYEARGLASNGGAAPTVGFYLDDVPLSPPALAQIGKVVIDPDLYDVNRVELLRGPQGTLYGSGSMGGTIKIVTNRPELQTYDASFQGTTSATQGGGLNGGGKFMLNIPFGELLALRVSATDTWRSGWIDRLVLNPFPPDTPLSDPPPYSRGNVLTAPVQSVDRDANTEHLYNTRASLLFQPNSDLSIVATAFYQRIVMGGYDEFDSPPGAAYLAHYQASDIQEGNSDRIAISSVTLTANLPFADLTSATAYWSRRESNTQDGSESYSYYNGITPYIAVPTSEIDSSHQFSQEVRLASRDNERLHWVTGVFFSDLQSTWADGGASPLNTAAPNGIFYQSYNPYRVKQSAVFADGSYRFSDTWTFSTGLRWFSYQSRLSESSWGSDAANLTPPAQPTVSTASDSGFTPRFNLSYAPTSTLTTYVSMSKGFRPGGANPVVAPPDIPPYCPAGSPLKFGPDSVWNYEVGEKAKLFGNWLSINSDFYYIKWTDVQETLLLSCGSQYIANAGNGRSFGPELEINAKLSNEWSLALSASYTDAKITDPSSQFVNSVVGSVSSCQSAANCTIPILNVPKDAASVAVVYSTRILGDYRLTARVSDNYVGSSYDEAYYFGLRLPSYSIANARVGLFAGKWSASLFVDNLTNKTAEISANNTSWQLNLPDLIRYSTNQPRTFGLDLNYHF
jgi:outer membrane receptor protein involved in Fe transport